MRFSGLPVLFRELVQRNTVTILLFHDIDKQTAEQAFAYLSKHYSIISLQDYLDARKNGRPLLKKALIITFDDGHIRNYELLSVFKRYDMPVTIFLCAGIVGTNRQYWFKAQMKSLDKASLKKITNYERLNILGNIGFKQEKEFDRPQALTKEQISEMRKFVNFQAHTLFHPILPKCRDVKAEEEILQSKTVLEKNFNLKINAIAYPNGDYSLRDIELAKQAGYECGLTIEFGFNTTQTDLFRLKRLSVNDTSKMDEFIVKASGVWGFFKTWGGRTKNGLHFWFFTTIPSFLTEPNELCFLIL